MSDHIVIKSCCPDSDKKYAFQLDSNDGMSISFIKDVDSITSIGSEGVAMLWDFLNENFDIDPPRNTRVRQKRNKRI